MFVEESKWFRAKIEQYVKEGACVLNVGSSTRNFREVVQPHIFSNLFQSLQEKKALVYHVDLKEEEGVDLVGDVTDTLFRKELQNLKPDIIICSNLLEHLEHRNTFCSVLIQILRDGGIMLVSCPKDYIYHADPIDTMFRPTVDELSAEFPHTEIVEGLVLQCGTYGDIELYERRINFSSWIVNKVKTFAKETLQPYNHGNETVERKVNRDDRISATCVVLRKIETRS